MDSRLEQAREWAEWADRKLGVAESHANALAAAEVIQSLPDQWIDAEKVAELADDMANWSLPDVPSTTEIDYRRLVEIMDGFTGRINDLLTPPLPTLAELIEQGGNQEDYAFRWVDTEDGVQLITLTNDECVYTLDSRGYRFGRDFHEITPLPDLPRLEWPGSGDAPTVAEHANVAPDQQMNPQVMLDSSLPRSEDVPEGEAWLVKAPGGSGEFVALKTGHAGYPWAFADNSETGHWANRAITLISRLVPEHKENA